MTTPAVTMAAPASDASNKAPKREGRAAEVVLLDLLEVTHADALFMVSSTLALIRGEG